jgi:hypothetical protein
MLRNIRRALAGNVSLFTVVINGQSQELRAQSHYFTATSRTAISVGLLELLHKQLLGC